MKDISHDRLYLMIAYQIEGESPEVSGVETTRLDLIQSG